MSDLTMPDPTPEQVAEEAIRLFDLDTVTHDHVASEIVDALRAAGLLHDPDTGTQWGISSSPTLNWPTACPSEQYARARATGLGWALVRRTIGPWQEVQADER